MNIQERIKAYFTNSRTKDLMLPLIFLAVIAGFWSYYRFVNTNSEIDSEQVTVQTNPDESIGSISGGSVGPDGKIENSSGAVAGASTSIAKKQAALNSPSKESWVARQIDRNSLKGSTYKVQKGDTLWQIAQGKYGSGFEWKKILEANKDKVGFLPNGSQALIEIGQELSLP